MPNSLKWVAVIAATLLIGLLAWSRITSGVAESFADSEQRTVLAVFAHPDDEFMVSPVLSKFARRGDRLHLAIASDGRYGVAQHAGIPAGDSLAKVRAGEIRCSAEVLGANPPHLFGLKDGFAHKEPELGKVMGDFEQIHNRVFKLIEELEPDAILTWGPGGGYGHPDHRAVSNIVTQVVQLGGPRQTNTLLYTGLSSEKFESLPEFSQPVIHWFTSQWHATAPEFLTIQIPYNEADLARARESLGCHQSQFTTEDMDELIELIDYVYDGELTLRPWNGDTHAAMNLLK